MLHAIAHIFGWNTGRVVSKTDDEGNIWIGFQCDYCGKISGKHIANSV